MRALEEALGAGRPVAVETVDFDDPARPPTCLEVDFPILPVNRIAAIEGNAGKPIYQISKWWARRRSSVFRSLLLAASMKAPQDGDAAKAVWDVYYGNHQEAGRLARLKVADIFMGGGTTIVEGSRLGMQMYGNDLNPVAWFIVKQELADVEPAAVQALLDDVEADVRPQVQTFYACECPRGHGGRWIEVASGKEASAGLDPLALAAAERRRYRYEAPEIVYVFWAKHGPCPVTGCGHRTPLMSSPVVATKTLGVRFWPMTCDSCKASFDVEEQDVRMAPGVPLVVAPGEKPFTVRDQHGGVACPLCGERKGEWTGLKIERAKRKSVELTLLVHPDWLRGERSVGDDGTPYGGSAGDSPESTAAWNEARARRLRLVEVRGQLPDEIALADGESFSTTRGTIPAKSTFECQALTCGQRSDILSAIKASGKTGPVAPYAVQGYCPACAREGVSYEGRFFALPKIDGYIDACREWERRREDDLARWWPRSELPYGFMTHHLNGGIPNHGFTHWWKMFNPRQLLVHAALLRSISNVGGDRHAWKTREYVLAAFQQYLRNQNMFCFWNDQRDTLEPMFSNNNYHPKSTLIENGVFGRLGRGNWSACAEGLLDSSAWSREPWELARLEDVQKLVADYSAPTKSVKVLCQDPLRDGVALRCRSSSDLGDISASSMDLVITDPPFGGLLHYAELADFFHVWLRLALKDHYSDFFTPEYTPKTLEAVANKARHPEDPDAFYKRVLTECWREAHRILKPAGILAFTFHHSEDAPWVAVLESLFDAGFHLVATYPIRSDETKGKGEFGAKQIEYDVIHVCRKRTEEPTPVSWARMRREVQQEVERLQGLLARHASAGLPAADLRVIRRGKALECYSRHYGKVFVDEGETLSVERALIGINQLLDDQGGKGEAPPAGVDPLSAQLLRAFDGAGELPRHQIQEILRGTGVEPADFEERGWCEETKRVFHLVGPRDHLRALMERPRRSMRNDYDQAMFLVGACADGSGVDATAVLERDGFTPHPALRELLGWLMRRGATEEVRVGADRASRIYRLWEQKNRERLRAQPSLFWEEEA